MIANILSRTIAIVLLAIPLGLLLFEYDQWDRAAQGALSPEELVAELESYRLESSVEAMTGIALVGVGFTLLVEVVAWLLRRLVFRRRVTLEPIDVAGR